MACPFYASVGYELHEIIFKVRKATFRDLTPTSHASTNATSHDFINVHPPPQVPIKLPISHLNNNWLPKPSEWTSACFAAFRRILLDLNFY